MTTEIAAPLAAERTTATRRARPTWTRDRLQRRTFGVLRWVVITLFLLVWL